MSDNHEMEFIPPEKESGNPESGIVVLAYVCLAMLVLVDLWLIFGNKN